MQGNLFLLSHISGFAEMIPTFLGLISNLEVNPAARAAKLIQLRSFPAVLESHRQPQLCETKSAAVVEQFPVLTPGVLVFLHSFSETGPAHLLLLYRFPAYIHAGELQNKYVGYPPVCQKYSTSSLL